MIENQATSTFSRLKKSKVFPLPFIFLGILAGALVLFAGCELSIPLEDEVSDPDAIHDVSTARAALASAYASLTLWQYHVQISIRSDDFVPTPILGDAPDLERLYSWTPSAIVNQSTTLWNEAYHTIALCNVLLERISGLIERTGAEGESEALEEISQRAMALKAYVYLHLLQLYGGAGNQPEAPGIILRQKAELSYPEQATVGESLREIRRLLRASILDPVQEISTGDRFWFNPLAAKCLLAWVELSAGNWDEARDHAVEVLRTVGPHQTPENYEALWAQQSPPPPNVLMAIDGAAFPTYREFDGWTSSRGDFLVVNPNLDFESGDLRKAAAFSLGQMYDTQLGETVPIRRYGKYNALRNAHLPIRYVVLLRDADASLIAAEAYSRLGQEDEAREILNTYLDSRRAPRLTESITGAELESRIREEHRREFAGEGRRFLRSRREGLPMPRHRTFGQDAGSIPREDFRWSLPIPASELKYNEHVAQNPGWAAYVQGKSTQ